MTDFSRELAKLVEDAAPEHPPPFGDVMSAARVRRRRRQAGYAASSVVVVVAGVVLIATTLDGSQQARPATGTTDNRPSYTTHDSNRSPEPTIPIPPDTDSGTPPPIQFLVSGATVNVAPYTYCWSTPSGDGGETSGVCADGWTQDKDLAEVGDPQTVDFWFFADGDWKFQATFSELGESCPRRITVPVEQTGAHSFRVNPAGLAGDYRVDLFGRGGGNDVAAAFRWSTRADGAMPHPDAYMGLVSDAGGDLHMYGLELSVSDLARTPQTATAAVTVTAANGRSMSIDATRTGTAQNCHTEGSANFTGDQAQSQQVLDLGPPPYTYDVTLTLDGSVYIGRGIWPTDERKYETPYVTLTFDPPLPPFTGTN